jgi:hypothetical protein
MDDVNLDITTNSAGPLKLQQQIPGTTALLQKLLPTSTSTNPSPLMET